MGIFHYSILLCILAQASYGESWDDVNKILQKKCVSCHNQNKNKGNLSLKTTNDFQIGGKSGRLIVPHNVTESLLWKRITSKDDNVMPPSDSDYSLSVEEKNIIGEWLASGAKMPVSTSKSWVNTPLRNIEELVFEKGSQSSNIERKIAYTLTGLPIKASFEDIDNILNSRECSEHFAEFWLDLVRYSDTAGDSADYPVREAWKYRDWVIDNIFLDIKSFVKSQLAGNTIPTGYIAISRRFGVSPAKNLTIDDTIDNIGKVFLGTTIACARCHDHKYEPISTNDYYGLYGIFNSIKYPFPGSEDNKKPTDFVVVGQDEIKKKAYDAQIKPLKLKIDALKNTANKTKDYLNRENLLRDVKDLEKQLNSIPLPSLDYIFGVSEDIPKDEKIHIRGNSQQKGELVKRGIPQFMGGYKITSGSGRSELADNILSQPLFYRVLANRIWGWVYGVNLISTTSDFGRLGAINISDVDRDNLDYAANYLKENGIKALIKKLILSEKFKLSNSRRLSSSELRDSWLMFSGELKSGSSLNHLFPPVEKWAYTQHNAFSYKTETMFRSVYQVKTRVAKQLFPSLFDGADPNTSKSDNKTTTTPVQALYMLNSEWMLERAKKASIRYNISPEEAQARMICNPFLYVD